MNTIVKTRIIILVNDKQYSVHLAEILPMLTYVSPRWDSAQLRLYCSSDAIIQANYLI